MEGANESAIALASLKAYLLELEDSGLYELPSAALSVLSKTEHGNHIESKNSRSKEESLDDIRRDIGDCRRCSLGEGRANLVFGVGNPNARLVFVGEAPGREEDIQGEPFVGEAGELLTKIIEAMGFKRSEVYICNVLKCRPPGNRNPDPKEMEECSRFMFRQIKAISPQVLVALGTFAAHALLSTKEPISKLRGRFHDYHGIPLMPTFHPAFLLRNPAMKREVWTDMQQVMKRISKD